MASYPAAVGRKVQAKGIVFTGQSRLTLPASPNDAPTLAMAGRAKVWANRAIAGSSWVNLTNGTGAAAGKPAVSWLYPYRSIATTCALFMGGGEGDLWGASTAAQVYTITGDYADAARAVGFGPIIVATVSGGNATWWDTADDAKRVAYNALLLADAGGKFDYQVDIDTAALAYASQPSLYADGLHYNSGGSAAYAALIDSTLDAVLV